MHIVFLAQSTNPIASTQRGIHVRFTYTFKASICYRIESLSTGLMYDFDPRVKAFSNAPLQPFGPTVDKGLGLYALDLPADPAAFPAGDYCVILHDGRIGNQVVGLHRVSLS